MQPLFNYIDKAKNVTKLIWFIIVLLIIAGTSFIKEAVVFILMKLYELFIQRNAIK